MAIPTVPTSAIIGTVVVIVSIILCLIAMSVDTTRDIYPFLLTLVIGLSLALFLCLVRISEMMRPRDLEYDSRKPLVMKSCPEYWTRLETTNNTLSCQNNFLTAEATPKKVYVYAPSDASTSVSAAKEYSVHTQVNTKNSNEQRCTSARDSAYAWIEPYQKCEAYKHLPRA